MTSSIVQVEGSGTGTDSRPVSTVWGVCGLCHRIPSPTRRACSPRGVGNIRNHPGAAGMRLAVVDAAVGVISQYMAAANLFIWR